MSTLSIDELKVLRIYAPDRYLSAINELIAIRELKGEQVPVAYLYMGDVMECKHVELAEDTDEGQAENCVPLFTAQQKPVEVSDSIAMQNVKDIAHCLSDIRRFIEAKFMTVGDLPSPEALLLSGPEWKHESDAIIAALNRVADFYEQPQKPVVMASHEDCQSCDRHYVDGMKAGWNFHEDGDNQGFIDSIERVQKDMQEVRNG